MSHYHAEVWVQEAFISRFPDKLRFPCAQDAIETILAPYNENGKDYDDNSGWWDWWQIGGRWTGAHVPGYDPDTDPNNIETCKICNGTGFRTDKGGEEQRAKDPTYTCNACGDFILDKNKKIVGWGHGAAGAGKAVKWPTSWEHFPGDIMEVKDIPESLDCYTLIVKDQVRQTEIWNGEDFVATGFSGLVVPKLKELGVTDGYLVTVDYHS